MDTQRFSLEGKVAVVSGGSQGLGLGYALALAQAGANVVIAARTVARLEQAHAEIEAASGRSCLAVRCDVTQRDEVRSLMDHAREHFGSVDIAVNNAGYAATTGIRPEYEDEETWSQTLAVDLTGLWNCCQEAAQHMLRAGRGSIINISSVFGSGGFPGGSPAAYFAAKGAVNNLTEFLAISWGDRNVRVNALAPTFCEAPGTREQLEATGMWSMLRNRHPMGRIATPDDLVGPLLFLASDASRFVTGMVLRVDGGYGAARGHHEGPYPQDEWDPQGRGRPLGTGTRR